MTEKPTRAQGYELSQASLVRQTCLYIATKLGDMMDHLVIIGGLVPSLLIDQTGLPEGVSQHVGTLDLDVGLTLALFDEARYRTLAEALRNAGFAPDKNAEGNPTNQRWRHKEMLSATLDFMIPPSRAGDKGGTLRHLEQDFAAYIAPGLQLAFQARVPVILEGITIAGEQARRSIWVCGAGAYIVLKALAFDGRGENKDAYDLHYVLANYEGGIDDIAAQLELLIDDESTRKAIAILKRDFLEHNAVGPRRVADFSTGARNDEIQADVVGFMDALLRKLNVH